MSRPLTGKVAIVTGASRGLGRQVAQRYWELGVDLVVVGRQRGPLLELAAELQGASSNTQRVVVIDVDLAISGATDHVVQSAVDNFGRLDVVVCNAAVQGPIGPLTTNDAASWRQTIDINLVAPAMLAAAASAVMMRQNWGRLILLSGGGAATPRPNFSAYAVAKAGLVRLAETLAKELEGTQICVNAVAPGAMPTEMLQAVAAAGAELSGRGETEAADRVLRDGNDTIDRAVDLIVFLASEAARGITGKLISAMWDRYEDWPAHLDDLRKGDLYTLRRITGRDRNAPWGDK